MKLSVGPIQYFWGRDKVLQFYDDIARAPVDIVYLGETVCSKRRALNFADWLEIGARLADAGKEVILSTLVLVEAASELSYMRRIVENGRYPVEANDMGAVNMLAGHAPFVLGPQINTYNGETLNLFAEIGAFRWVPPVELGSKALSALQSKRPPQMQTEIFAYGRLALAFSARCFTARAHCLPKDSCQFRCGDYPNGMQMQTREEQQFLVLNGVQVQSDSTVNLMRELPKLRELNIDILRLSPQYRNMQSVIASFRALVDGDASLEQAIALLGDASEGRDCNGFWHDLPGKDWLIELDA